MNSRMRLKVSVKDAIRNAKDRVTELQGKIALCYPAQNDSVDDIRLKVIREVFYFDMMVLNKRLIDTLS